MGWGPSEKLRLNVTIDIGCEEATNKLRDIMNLVDQLDTEVENLHNILRNTTATVVEEK